MQTVDQPNNPYVLQDPNNPNGPYPGPYGAGGDPNIWTQGNATAYGNGTGGAPTGATGTPNGSFGPNPNYTPPTPAPGSPAFLKPGQTVAPGTPQAWAQGSTDPNPAWTTDPQFSAMPGWLKQIYMSTGTTPGGPGSGPLDWQYWANTALKNANGDVNYVTQRLTADLKGTGQDVPGNANLSPFQLSALTYSPSAAVQGAPSASDVSNFGQFLMGRATGQIPDSSLPALQVDPNDPIIRAQTDAYRLQDTNASKNYLSNLAATSGPNTNISAETRAANEQVGQDVAGFQASAMQTELSARRAEIQSALQGEQGFITSEQALQLQDEAQQIDAQLAEMGLGMNESQFERNLAEHSYEYDQNNSNSTFA